MTIPYNEFLKFRRLLLSAGVDMSKVRIELHVGGDRDLDALRHEIMPLLMSDTEFRHELQSMRTPPTFEDFSITGLKVKIISDNPRDYVEPYRGPLPKFFSGD